ncbi:MAG: hypothetical protein NT166_26585 [Candidatus Aminicenantes bacterium]|nr:hypothetical protein [Candidatus Aminicenantes bacterium]
MANQRMLKSSKTTPFTILGNSLEAIPINAPNPTLDATQSTTPFATPNARQNTTPYATFTKTAIATAIKFTGNPIAFKKNDMTKGIMIAVNID